MTEILYTRKKEKGQHSEKTLTSAPERGKPYRPGFLGILCGAATRLRRFNDTIWSKDKWCADVTR